MGTVRYTVDREERPKTFTEELDKQRNTHLQVTRNNKAGIQRKGKKLKKQNSEGHNKRWHHKKRRQKNCINNYNKLLVPVLTLLSVIIIIIATTSTNTYGFLLKNFYLRDFLHWTKMHQLGLPLDGIIGHLYCVKCTYETSWITFRLPCARHCTKHFTSMISVNLHRQR